MAAPSIRVNGGTAGVKASVSASAAVTATLDSTDGVRQVTWSVLATDETSAAASYTLVQSGSVGQNVAFTSLGAGTAMLLKAVINAGVDPQTGQSNATTTSGTVKVYVPTAAGFEVGCAGERYESDSTFGATGIVNAGVRAVDSLAPGGIPVKIVKAATTAALPANTRTGNVLTASANGALPAQDGVTLSPGDRFLTQNEGGGASHVNNGLYTLTTAGDGSNPWTATRATDWDASPELVKGTAIRIQDGTVYGGRERIYRTSGATINVTAQEFGADGYAPADAQYLCLTANANLSAESAIDAIGTTIPFASTSTTPVSLTRTDAATADTVNVLTCVASSAGTTAADFGPSITMQAKQGSGATETLGRIDCVWTDVTGASEDSKWVLRSRKAAAAVTSANAVAAEISPIAVTLPVLAGVGTRAVTADANGLLSTAALASAAALYLEDATSAVTTNGRPIRSLAAALDFNRANGLPVTVANTLATSGTKIPVFSFRRLTGGVGANNDGGYISLTIPDGTSTETEAARLGWSWQAVTGTYGEVTLGVRNNLGLSSQYTFDSGGKLTTTSLAATGLSVAGLVTNNASGVLSTSATAVLCNGTVPANLTAGINVTALASGLAFSCDGDFVTSFSRTEAGTDDVFDAIIAERLTGDTAAAGIGVGVLLKIQNAGGDSVEAARIAARLTTATAAAEDGEIVWSTIENGALAENAAISASGIIWREAATAGISQAKRAGTGANDGGTLAITAQAGQDVAAGTNNDGGAIEVASGAVGGGGTGGSAGDVVLKTGSTPRLTLQGDGSDALFASATTTHVVERSVPYNGGDATGAVTLDFSQSNKIEVGALVDDVTFTITGAVVGARYSVIVRQHASVAKTTTWANGLFASGRDAIGTTVGTYTAWQFEVMTGGTIVCVGREADIVIP